MFHWMSNGKGRKLFGKVRSHQNMSASFKRNGSIYMFASAEMSWHVAGVISKYFNVLNHISWSDKQSMSSKHNREELRRYINNSEEIIFANQFNTNDDKTRNIIFEPIHKYLDDARKTGLTKKQINHILGSTLLGGGVASHHFRLFKCGQFTLPTEEHYNKLEEHMDLKPYEESKT